MKTTLRSIAAISFALSLHCGKQSTSPSAGKSEAGLITESNKATRLIGGPAATGRVGDYYIQNSKVRFVIQAPGRDIGPSPYGGNLVDADLVRSPGEAGNDHVGELSLFLNIGRTSNFTSIAILNDGANGGSAQIRATGSDDVNDYINVNSYLVGAGLASFLGFNPNSDLPLQIQALYTLEPDKTFVRVQYTLVNESAAAVPVSIGAFLDSGGKIEAFRPGSGFGDVSISNVAAVLSSPVMPYVGHQAPGVAYGVYPNLPADAGGAYPEHGVVTVAGVTVMVFNTSSVVAALLSSPYSVPASGSLSFEVDLIVGTPDIAAIDKTVSELRGRATGTVSGQVIDSATDAGRLGVRVSVVNAADAAATVFETNGAGAFGGALPVGTYTLRPEGLPLDAGTGTEATVAVTAGGSVSATFAVPPLGTLPFTVVDQTDAGSPCRLSFIGADPAPSNANQRFVTSDRATGLYISFRSRYGTSDLDGPVVLQPGTYKLVISRGPEYSVCTTTPFTVTAGVNARVTCALTRVVDSAGYVAGDFHQHTNRSPDSPVPTEDRLKGYLAEGIEFFASSDHDFVTDYAPVIASLAAESLIKFVPGVEATPFDYGHFNGYPLNVDATKPSNGAVDWGTATVFNLLPEQIFAVLRDAGAQVVQVNHPRVADPANAKSAFQQYFDRAGLAFDMTLGVAFGVPDGGQTLPNDVLRLPMDQPFWSDKFDAVEIYNGFKTPASNPDGLGRDDAVDRILRDWFNFLSIGKKITAMGVSDTHGLEGNPGGYPRTYIRVANDNVATLDPQQVMTGILAQAAFVTNGPFVEIWAGNDKDAGGPGKLVAADGGVIVHVKVQTPTWMDIAQIELYVNNAFPETVVDGGLVPLVPVATITALDGGPLGVATVAVGSSSRYEAEATFTVNVTGGRDAWAVAVVRGRTVLFPVIPQQAKWSGTDYVNTLPYDGIRPLAITNPVFLDFNGNGVYNPPNRP